MASIDSALSPVKPGRKELWLAPYALHGQTKLACIHECLRQAVFLLHAVKLLTLLINIFLS